jgi:Mrp family chromosome partitioning ATPase
MSSLDQAFIRAYHGPTSTTPPKTAAGTTARTAASAVAPAMVAAEPALAAVADTAAGTQVVDRPANSGRQASVRIAEAPSERIAVPTQVTENRRRHFLDSAHERQSPPHYFDAPTTEAPAAAAGLSTSESAGSTLAAAEPADGWQPAYETRCFAWPRNVEVLIAAAGSEFAEFARELQDRVHAGRKTLVVTSAERGEGRTTVLLALARLAANRNLKTVVVDVDLGAPQLAEQLGLRPELGWDDVYAERLPATDALIEGVEDRLTVLPLRSPLADPRSLAGKSGLGDILSELRSHYDLVLLDAGPLSDDPQAIDLAAVLGGATIDDGLVVRDRRRTHPKQVQAVCRRLSALGVRHWDIAENFTEIQGY